MDYAADVAWPSADEYDANLNINVVAVWLPNQLRSCTAIGCRRRRRCTIIATGHRRLQRQQQQRMDTTKINNTSTAASNDCDVGVRVLSLDDAASSAAKASQRCERRTSRTMTMVLTKQTRGATTTCTMRAPEAHHQVAVSDMTAGWIGMGAFMYLRCMSRCWSLGRWVKVEIWCRIVCIYCADLRHIGHTNQEKIILHMYMLHRLWMWMNIHWWKPYSDSFALYT